MLAEPTLFREAAGTVGAGGALVAAIHFQEDAVQVVQAEGAIEQEPHGVAPVAAPPVDLVADGDAQLAGAGGMVEAEEGALADELTVRLDGEAGAVAAPCPAAA